MVNGYIHTCAELLGARYDDGVACSQSLDGLYQCVCADTGNDFYRFGFARAVEEHFVLAHFGDNGLRGNGQRILVFLPLQGDGGIAAGHDAAGVGVEGTYGQGVRVDVETRFAGVDLCVVGVQRAFQREGEVGAHLDVAGVAFGYGELQLQGRNLGELGHDGGRRGIGADAYLAQADDAVEGGTQLGLGYLRLDAFNVGVQGSQFGLDLLVGFLADGIALQQGVLAEHTVFGQLQLRNQSLQLGLQGTVVHLGQQLAFLYGGAFFEIDFYDFARGFKGQVYFFVGDEAADDGHFVGQHTGVYDDSIDVQRFLSPTLGGHYLIGFRQFFVRLGHLRIDTPSYQPGTDKGNEAPFYSLLHSFCDSWY